MACITQHAVLHVHAATAQELEAAKAVLQQAQLVANKGRSPEETEYCELQYVGVPHVRPDDDDGSRSNSSFDVSAYLQHLHTAVLGRLVLAAEAIASTQTVIQDNVATLPDGALCVADKQIGGKGQRLPFVQYLVSLAAVHAIQAEAKQRLQGGTLDVRIKWPNDLYSGGLKIGGVLCHSSYRGQLFYVIMGVGLNVSNREPTTCVDALVEAEAKQLGLPPPPPVTREVLLAGMMTRLEAMLDVLCQQGFQPLEQDYYQAWLHSGQEVRLEEDGQLVAVRVSGLSQHGYLEAVDGQGERYELHPDGNSFDFFKGLVRKKTS
ncbi:hypothetical protein N2152v2_002318 [Parachlorella kessleri]